MSSHSRSSFTIMATYLFLLFNTPNLAVANTSGLSRAVSFSENMQPAIPYVKQDKVSDKQLKDLRKNGEKTKYSLASCR